MSPREPSNSRRGWAHAVDGIVLILIVAFALVVAYPYLPGSGSEAFKGIALVLGLMFSLGSPSVIGNVVAGLGLAFRGRFKVGDRVRIGEHVGEVTQVRLLTTYFRSPKNEQIMIPNSMILNSEVVNYSALAEEQGLILHTNVGIGYETPVAAGGGHAARGARPHAGPAPAARSVRAATIARRLRGGSTSSTCTPTSHAPMLALYTALHRSILDVFNEYGVQIMTPAYEGDPEQPKVVPAETGP